MNTDCFRCGAGEEKSGKNKTRSFSLASIESFPSLPRQRKLIISIPCRLYHVKLSSHSSRLYCGFKLISLCRHRLASSPSFGKRCGGGKRFQVLIATRGTKGEKFQQENVVALKRVHDQLGFGEDYAISRLPKGGGWGEARIMKRSRLRTLRPSG
jgi:hypothetical protein